MITIIERGSKKVITCKYCGCKFSYDNEDLKITDVPSQNYSAIVECPQCERELETYNGSSIR